MRKDVKLAFAVGAVLISVLIVYVLVVPGGDKRPDKQAVTLDQGDKATPTVPQPAGTDKPAPSTPDKSTDTAKPAEVASDQKPSDASPTTKPTDPFAGAGDKEDTWMLALNRGSVPMMTEAPAALQPGQTRSKSTKSSADETRTQKASQPPTLMAQSPVTVDQTTPSTQPIMISDPAPSHPGMRTHTVAKGETISKIAEAAYGSQNYWPYIVRANPGIVAEKIRPGMTLNLPAESEVKGTGTTTASPVSTDATATKADPTAIKPDTTSPKLDPQTQYEVQSGDSLAKIAMKLYGNSNKWQAIYDLNKEAIGDNPAKLKLKSVLKLPEPPTQK